MIIFISLHTWFYDPPTFTHSLEHSNQEVQSKDPIQIDGHILIHIWPNS